MVKIITDQLDSVNRRRLLILVQLLTLAATALCLVFLYRTTGGTLFLFSALVPLHVSISIVILIAVLFWEYRHRHSMFLVEHHEPGSVIIEQGTLGSSAYFIRTGEVEVVRGGDQEGEVVVLAKLGVGDYFGETALLSNEPRNASVRASTKTTLAVLGKSNFLTLLKVLPEIQENVIDTIRERALKEPRRRWYRRKKEIAEK